MVVVRKKKTRQRYGASGWACSDPRLFDALNALAAARTCPRSAIIREALAIYLRNAGVLPTQEHVVVVMGNAVTTAKSPQAKNG